VADPVVVAYDVGTSGVKAVVVDARGRVLASRVESYGLLTPRPTWVEQDVETMIAALGVASRGVIDELRLDVATVAGVGVTAQMFSIVPADRDGRPLRPMLSWLDQRTEEEAATLQARAGVDRGFGAFDAVLTAKDIVPKITWLRAHNDDPRTAWYLDCKEAVVASLTGEVVTDPCGASAYRLIDPASGAWDEAACDLAEIPSAMLPPIGDATGTAGALSAAAASLTGLLAGTPVVVGAGDVPAGQVGAGASADGDAHLSLGTAAYFGITTARHRADPERRLGPLRHVLPGRWIVWLETATGGGALAWFGRQLAGFAIDGRPAFADHEAMDRAAGAVADAMDGLLFAPWLTGERVPLFDDSVRGAFVGLALHHGPAHLARAVMEGVALQIATAFEYGLAFGIAPGPIRAVGGGGIGTVWTSIIADTLGRPLEIVAEPQDAAARGAGACALVGTGLASHLEAAVPAVVDRIVEPDAGRAGEARARLERFRRLHPALSGIAQPSGSVGLDRADADAVPV
jgi:xylulokinase